MSSLETEKREGKEKKGRRFRFIPKREGKKRGNTNIIGTESDLTNSFGGGKGGEKGGGGLVRFPPAERKSEEKIIVDNFSNKGKKRRVAITETINKGRGRERGTGGFHSRTPRS